MKALHITPLVLMSAGVLFAQTAVPSAPQEQPIELSPFVITETADNGYAATETLSGTRLRTAAKDVPAALSCLSSPDVATALSCLSASVARTALSCLRSPGVTTALSCLRSPDVTTALSCLRSPDVTPARS